MAGGSSYYFRSSAVGLTGCFQTVEPDFWALRSRNRRYRGRTREIQRETQRNGHTEKDTHKVSALGWNNFIGGLQPVGIQVHLQGGKRREIVRHLAKETGLDAV